MPPVKLGKEGAADDDQMLTSPAEGNLRWQAAVAFPCPGYTGPGAPGPRRRRGPGAKPVRDAQDRNGEFGADPRGYSRTLPPHKLRVPAAGLPGVRPPLLPVLVLVAGQPGSSPADWISSDR
jgi:hypothetical protein